MKASSSIGSASSDKAFGLSAAGAAAGGQGSSGTGFLAMLGGMIQSVAAGSAGASTSNTANNAGSQLSANSGDHTADIDADLVEEAAGINNDAQDGIIPASPAGAATVQNAPTQINGQATQTIDQAQLMQAEPILAVMPQVMATAAAPLLAQSGPAKAAPASTAGSTDDSLAALAVQAGLVPVAQAAAAAPVITISAAQPVTASASTQVAAANSATSASGPVSNDALAGLTNQPIVASQPVSSPVVESALPGNISASLTENTAQASAPQANDHDNSDSQQSAILAALFAQAPQTIGQVLPQGSSADVSASAKPVSGVAANAATAGILSVPGVGIPPTLSPPAFVGNGSNNAHTPLSSVVAQASAQDPAGAPAAASFGIGAAASAATASSAASDDDQDDAAAPAPAEAATNQAKAEDIAALFNAPPPQAQPGAKATKSSDDDGGQGASVGVPVAADTSTAGLTLVHQSTSAGAPTAAALTGAPAGTIAASPANQVSVVIQRAASAGTQSMTIALDPIELGKVEVKLNFAKDGSVQASVTAERPETLTMLKNDHSTLTQALHNAGLSTDSNSLSFNLKDGGQSQQQQGFANASAQRPRSDGAQSADADTTASPTTTVHYAVSAGNGRLDVRV